MTSAAPSKTREDKEKTFSLSLSHSLTLLLVNCHRMGTGQGLQLQHCTQKSIYSVYWVWRAHRGSRDQDCFIEHTNFGFQPESFYFKELINFFYLKPNCCIMRPREKSGLLYTGWMKPKWERILKYNSIWPVFKVLWLKCQTFFSSNKKYSFTIMCFRWNVHFEHRFPF